MKLLSAIDENKDVVSKEWVEGKGYTTNTGTITGVSVNGSSVATSGVANITEIPTSVLREPRFQNSSTITNRTLFTMVRGNRLAFLPADQIIVEQSSDAGVTWTSAGLSDAQKKSLFSGLNNGAVNLPKKDGKMTTDGMIRITISGMKYNVPSGTAETDKYNYWNSTYIKSTERYCTLHTLYFWINASENKIWLKVERATGANPNTWYTIFDTSSNANRVGMSGWSGMDFVTFSSGVFGGGTNQTSNYWNYRLTFRTCSNTTTSDATLFDDSKLGTSYITGTQSINGISGYGDSIWTTPNNLAGKDHLYTWDVEQNAFFPGSVYPSVNNSKDLGSSSLKWANIYATNLSGNLTGNVTGNLTGTASKATGDKNGDDITTTYYKASNPNGYTSNTGTITGITMNGSSKGTSGVVDLGTVITSHQSIKTVNNNTMTGTGNVSVGTITKVQANGTDVASSGTANIPAASTSAYGVTKLSNATDSTSEVLAATPKAVKAAYDLAAGKGTGTITGVSVNGTSVATSGVANITSVPASILSGAIANGVTATTQSAGDNSTKVATTAYVDTAITNLPEPMIFKGSLGTGGTITTLPAASSSNEGYTYKVITAGTYASQTAKVGDTFISDGSSWVLIPSGDEPAGTVTSVTLKATSPIAIDSESAITSSGTRTLSHANSGVTAGTYKSVTVNATGHVTGGTNPTTISGYGITDAKINNGTITLGSNSITPLTSFTETDPVFSASPAAGITSNNITAWNAAEANVQSDWNQTTTTADDYIKNKPTNVSSFTNDANYVTNTDYANNNNVGVIKAKVNYGLLSTDGELSANVVSYSDYIGGTVLHPNGFISKGTLDNVIAGKNWLTKNVTNGDIWAVGLTNDGHLYYEYGLMHEDVSLAKLSELSTKQNTILSGTTDPSSSLGSDGDVYIKIDTTT